MFHVKHSSDVIVIGGGHAGIEAALACARRGCLTLLITLKKDKIGEMSCNPSIGGIGKGQLVHEIDALGGEMGKTADLTGIQFKRLNTRKGSAVQSLRCQSDKKKYAEQMQKVVLNTINLEVIEAEVEGLWVEKAAIKGVSVRTNNNLTVEIESKAVVITAGTFMRGVMHCGSSQSYGGRFGEPTSKTLSESLSQLGLRIHRLKTGTPPRVLRDSVDFSRMEIQFGNVPPKGFSFSRTEIALPQVPCYLAYTNGVTHDKIRENLHLSPLFSGQIKGIGPRYCPSIEDKVVKFPEKPRHHIFFEPESLSSDWIYPNGCSTSLPPEVQETFLKTIPGCENVQFARYGYAVEYDCIDPTQLTESLEVKNIRGLFLAGQVNGTSGYEEAACQGLMAGINASNQVLSMAPFTLSRSEAYIGVLISDLTSLGVSEPYRMFTSRAEFRLSLREDNADLRLTGYGISLGLILEEQANRFKLRREHLRWGKEVLSLRRLKPSEAVQKQLKVLGSEPLPYPQTALQLLKRPELDLMDVLSLMPNFQCPFDLVHIRESLEVDVKYEGYINVQQEEIQSLQRLKNVHIPDGLNYELVMGLSKEIVEKLKLKRPQSLGEASRISGVTPAALNALLFYLQRYSRNSSKKGHATELEA